VKRDEVKGLIILALSLSLSSTGYSCPDHKFTEAVGDSASTA
jgi:hypothetical protein